VGQNIEIKQTDTGRPTEVPFNDGEV